MKTNLLTYFASFAFSSIYFIIPTAVYASNELNWKVEGDITGEYNSNIAQTKDLPGDFINIYSGTGTLKYLAPSNTRVLARVQAQYNKYLNLGKYDRLLFAGSLTLSQWFFNSLNLYVGLHPIQQISTVNSKKPFDIYYLGGLTYFLPFGDDLSYGGYQIDRLNASVNDLSSLNHTFLVGLQHPFNKSLIGHIGARVRLRNLDIAPDDTRFSGNFSLHYLITKWFTVKAGGEYTYVNSPETDKNIGFFNFGINLIGGYNNSLNF